MRKLRQSVSEAFQIRQFKLARELLDWLPAQRPCIDSPLESFGGFALCWDETQDEQICKKEADLELSNAIDTRVPRVRAERLEVG